MKNYLPLLGLLPTLCFAKITFEDLKFAAFIDTYYAYDLNRPKDGDRLYTTHAAKHSEFNLNLAYLGLKLEKNKVRARLAYQAGQAAEVNYSFEPTRGNLSGARNIRPIQEAYVGYKFNQKTVADAGIYFSHIGFENFISARSWNYTRSLLLDYVPYYFSGIRLSHQADKHWSGQLHLVNGWQNATENNHDKALGAQLAYKQDDYALTYNNFYGKELKQRFFHNFIFSHKLSSRLEMAASYDIGFQSSENWWGGASWLRYKTKEHQWIAVRGEYLTDPHERNIKTGTSHGFTAKGGSINYDVALEENVLFRNEYRYLSSRDPIFPKHSGLSREDHVFVSALSVLIE